MGIVFGVYNDLVYGFKENVYQKAIAKRLKEEKITFKEQVRAKLIYRGKKIGYLVLDFLIYDKIVVELKQRNYFSRKDINQIYSYLKAVNMKLGLLIHFTREGIQFKRVLNIIIISTLVFNW